MKYKCPYCDYETDHLFVFLLHISEHPEWWNKDNSVYGKFDGQHTKKEVELSFSLKKL